MSHAIFGILYFVWQPYPIVHTRTLLLLTDNAGQQVKTGSDSGEPGCVVIVFMSLDATNTETIT